MAIKCYKDLDSNYNYNDEFIFLEWADVLSKIYTSEWNGLMYTKYVPVGAKEILIKDDGSLIIKVNDLRLLLDNLSNGGVNIAKLNLKASRYLNDIQGYNSIILYKGWFCRVDSCGGVILCKEQEAYDRGLLAK